MRIGRRTVLLGAGALLVAGAVRFTGREAPLDFELDPVLPGFRHMAGGGASRAAGARFDPLVGISAPPDPAGEALRTAVRGDPCRALFGGPPAPGTVPVASFSDYNCPYCRVTTERLATIEARSGGAVDVRWHELPLLGEGSQTAARAALAAARQGAYPAMHAQLMRSRLLPTPR